MLSAERHEDIVRRVDAEGSVKVAELSTLYGVTADCIRKDLRALERQGLLKRTYGGAVRLRVNRHELDVDARLGRNAAGKRAIAARALDLIAAGSTVFLDISTANIELALLLRKGGLHATVVTNMLAVAHALAGAESIRTIVIGGAFNSTRDGFVGSLADEQIRRFRFDVAFMGTAGVDTERNAVFTYLPEDGLTKAAALSVSRQSFLVAEAGKFLEDGDFAYARLDDFGGIVLDSDPGAAERRRLEQAGLGIYIPELKS